jgi:hypothetical protein
LEVKNNSIIEFAHEAVLFEDEGLKWSTGGMIFASNSTFRNNWRSLQFLEYQGIGGSNKLVDYVSLISNCSFIWDDEFMLESPEVAISLYRIKGLHIMGCTFEDKRSNSHNENRAKGIGALDASFKCIGVDLSGTCCANHDFYNETNYDVCKFIGLKTAIEYYANEYELKVEIDHSLFVNCRNSIINSGANMTKIIRNKFTYDGDYISLFDDEPIGIVLDQSFGFNVEGNLFYNYAATNSTGIFVRNTSDYPNKLYRNKFDSQNIGIYTVGYNGSYSSSTGLQFLCNNFSNGNYDIFVDNLEFQGANFATGPRICNNQGSVSQSAGNVFSNPIGSSNFFIHDYNKSNIKGVAYYKFPSTLMNYYSGPPITILNANMNSCPSVYLTELDVFRSKSEATSRNPLINASSENESIIYEAMFESEFFIQNHELSPEINSLVLMKSYDYFQRIKDFEKKQYVKEALSVKKIGLDEYQSIEIEDFLTFKSFQEENMQNFVGNVELKKLEYFLRFYKDHFIGLSAVQANNYLCFYLGECDSYKITTGELKEKPIIFSEKHNSQHSISPNPFYENFIIEGDALEEISKLTMFDLKGNEVDCTWRNYNEKIIVTTKSLPIGMYFVTIEMSVGLLEFHKVIRRD